jgi:predicted anti-sigma-YlaC factor YlaD
MNDQTCDVVRERIPDLVGGRIAPPHDAALRAHLADCDDCGAEAGLAALLLGSRPSAPPDLASRIEGSLRFRRASVSRPWWGMAAAAVAALALGIGVTSRNGVPADEVPAFVAGAGESSVWIADDGYIAGAPTFGDLTDEALITLLEEMSAGPSGGAA